MENVKYQLIYNAIFQIFFAVSNRKRASPFQHSGIAAWAELLHMCTGLGCAFIWKPETSGALRWPFRTLAHSGTGASSSGWPFWPPGEWGCSTCAGRSWAPAPRRSPRWTILPPSPTACWSGWVLSLSAAGLSSLPTRFQNLCLPLPTSQHAHKIPNQRNSFPICLLSLRILSDETRFWLKDQKGVSPLYFHSNQN